MNEATYDLTQGLELNKCDIQLEESSAVNETLSTVAEIMRDAPESPISSNLNDLRSLRDRLPVDSALFQQANRLVLAMENAEGELDLSLFLQKQPTATELSFPMRYAPLLARATKRMHKTKYALPHPQLILTAVTHAASTWDSARDQEEIVNRVAHALAFTNLALNGFELSIIVRRLLTDNIPTRSAALQKFLDEARRGIK